GLQAPGDPAGGGQSAGHRAVLHSLHPGLLAGAAAPDRADGSLHCLPGHCLQRRPRVAGAGILRHLAGQLPGRRRHAAADQRDEHAQCAACRGQAAHQRTGRGRGEGRHGRQHRRGAADHSAAHGARHHLHGGDLCRAGADRAAAGRAGGLWGGDRAGLGRGLHPGRSDRPGAGQDRHQRDDPPDGPDPGGAGRRGDGAGPGQAVPSPVEL
ncbi:MAG: UPF0056 inner membrane protein YchE, partial [uncultured Ramlibacter sp.]